MKTKCKFECRKSLLECFLNRNTACLLSLEKNSYITKWIASETLRMALNVPRFSLENINIVTSYEKFIAFCFRTNKTVVFGTHPKITTTVDVYCLTLLVFQVWLIIDPKKVMIFGEATENLMWRFFGKYNQGPWNDQTDQIKVYSPS